MPDFIAKASNLDLIIYGFIPILAGAFIFIIHSYIKGLKDSPREIWILFSSKLIEYAAYGAMNMTFVLFLSKDINPPLSDMSAGSFIAAWSIIITMTTMLVGSICDAIGIKKTLLIGTATLLFGRFFMPHTDNIIVASLLGFVPMAFGTAIMGPVLSVGIKKFTTKEGTTLGFGLFYTMMNVGWATGAWIFDEARSSFGEYAGTTVPIFGHLSTYQLIFLIGFLLTIPTFILVLLMRDGVAMTEKGVVVTKAEKTGKKAIETVKTAVHDTFTILSQVVKEKAFWRFIFMLGVLVFVRLTFYHFHYTFPKYGIRVLGQGVKIGHIYGVLNPTIIIFLVPFVAALTKKVKSYKMMVIGTFLSAFSVFIATFPSEMWSGLIDSWVGELVYIKFLGITGERIPEIMGLVVFVILFTIGEAFWSPRLMQFTAEIAPKGKEGTYIALSYLPYFGAKFIVGPLSGWLVHRYTPTDMAGNPLPSYPEHYMVWIWIGGMAIITPLGLVIFRKLFKKSEQEQEALNAETK